MSEKIILTVAILAISATANAAMVMKKMNDMAIQSRHSVGPDIENAVRARHTVGPDLENAVRARHAVGPDLENAIRVRHAVGVTTKLQKLSADQANSALLDLNQK
jgi:hypothetical protein